MQNNDFTLPQTREKAKYKLWVKYKASYTRAGQGSVKCFYGYQLNGDYEKGLELLLGLLTKHRRRIKKAILYDNLTKKELKRYYL